MSALPLDTSGLLSYARHTLMSLRSAKVVTVTCISQAEQSILDQVITKQNEDESYFGFLAGGDSGDEELQEAVKRSLVLGQSSGAS